MKKIITIIFAALAAIMILSFAGCSDNENNSGKSLYDHGLELVALVEEMAKSEEYMAIYTGSPRISEIASEFGKGDYSSPKTVYGLAPAAEFLTLYKSSDEINGLSEDLKDMISNKTIAALVTQVNAMGGAENLAATTVCTAGKTFVNSEINDTAIYIYVYENGFPVAVTFTAGEDSTVSASAMFISYDEFPTASAQQIADFFDGAVTAAEISK